jgi:hypothetical protein
VQVVILLLLVAALGCLIIGLMISNTVWIASSVAVSVLAVLAIRAARRRADEAPAQRAEHDTELIRPTGAREEIAALAGEAAAERAAAQAAQATPEPALAAGLDSESVPAVESEREAAPATQLEPAVRPKRVAQVPGRGARRLAAVSSPSEAPEDQAEPTLPPVRRRSRSTRQRGGKAVAVVDASWHPDVEELPQHTTETAGDAEVLPGLAPARELAVKRDTLPDEEPGAAAADLVVSQPTTDQVAVGDDDPADEPAPANTHAPLIDKGNESVWVVDGRPRYHLSSCGFLAGQDAEPIPLQQAVEDGFSPCSQCDPDTALASA